MSDNEKLKKYSGLKLQSQDVDVVLSSNTNIAKVKDPRKRARYEKEREKRLAKQSQKSDSKQQAPPTPPATNLVADKESELHSRFRDFAGRCLKYDFRNINILVDAMTHESYVNENPGESSCLAKFSFLGNSVIGEVVTAYLCLQFMDENVGTLTQWKSMLGSKKLLNEVATKLGFSQFIRVGLGVDRQSHQFHDCIQSVVGAIYLDGGHDAAKAFVTEAILVENIETTAAANEAKFSLDPDIQNFKNKLQEVVQRTYKGTKIPTYIVTSEDGPDHLKSFDVAVYLDDKLLGTGHATTKKKADQIAAEEALNGWKESGHF